MIIKEDLKVAEVGPVHKDAKNQKEKKAQSFEFADGKG